jgi:catechol 2,3-dioxygenase-like lactoylglutathione lyase family enzyme
MKVIGLDRIIFMVRDMDKAVNFFSKKFGMKFMELSKEISERDRVRCCVSLENHLQLLSPILPVPENAPPPVKKRVELLKEKEMIFLAITYKIDDTESTEAEIDKEGFHIQHKYEGTKDYVSIGMDNFFEFVLDDKDTFGITMGLVQYDPVKGDK